MVLSISLLAACGGNDPELVQGDKMSINSCYVMRSNSLSENFSSPIGLYILAPDGAPYNADSYKNSASLISGSWSVTTPVYIMGSGLLYAYYPYSIVDNPPTLNVNVSNQVDMLYNKIPSSIAPGSSSLSIKLYHAMSQLQVNIEDEEISELSFYSPRSGKFNICTGVFSNLIYGDVVASSGQMLIVPHRVSGAELHITLEDGAEYSYPLDGMTFSPGENYTYQFELNENRERLEIQSFSVEEWVNDFIYNDYLR